MMLTHATTIGENFAERFATAGTQKLLDAAKRPLAGDDAAPLVNLGFVLGMLGGDRTGADELARHAR
jgi:hypothetical protein